MKLVYRSLHTCVAVVAVVVALAVIILLSMAFPFPELVLSGARCC